MIHGDARTVLCLAGAILCGCELGQDDSTPEPPVGTATYVGAAACQSCHSNVGVPHAIHGHSQALKKIEGNAPAYPPSSEGAGVPDPPAGLGWSHMGYVIGGYTKSANFVDTDGFVLTDGVAGTGTLYALSQEQAGVQAGFVPYLPDQTSAIAYVYECFRCHTTGAESVDVNGGLRQDNRLGIGGTWTEGGVQCESCHGPGSRHIPDPSAGNIVLEGASGSCKNCHVGTNDPTVLAAADGFIVGMQQYTEVQASPHAGFACTVCHDPHVSVVYDEANGLRNECQDCHTDKNLGFHQGRVFVQGDYVENLSCESCHMPFAGRNAVSAAPEFTNGIGRIGDTRSHIMFIDVLPRGFAAMFSADGRQVVTDSSGKSAVTLDFVCLRCHTGEGSAFVLDLENASFIANGIHDRR